MMRRTARDMLTVAPTPLFRKRVPAEVEPLLAAHALHTQALTRAEADIVEITQRAVAAIVRDELTLTPAHIRRVVHELVEEVRAAQEITLHVHPEDHALLPLPEVIASEAEARGKISIVDDLTLSRGDCVLRSSLGDIDGRIEVKLEQLERWLTRRMPA